MLAALPLPYVLTLVQEVAIYEGKAKGKADVTINLSDDSTYF